MGSVKDKLHTGELYLPQDQELMAEQLKLQDRLYEYNLLKPSQTKAREAMLHEILAGTEATSPLLREEAGRHWEMSNVVGREAGLKQRLLYRLRDFGQEPLGEDF